MTSKPIFLAVIVLALSVLACTQVTVTLTPPPIPATHQPGILPTVTRVPTVANTPTWTAQVELPTVNVRAEPGGRVIGTLKAGATVTIVQCDGNWCQIEPRGWVFKGCLSIESDLGCKAK